jgi:hypothetical protein
MTTSIMDHFGLRQSTVGEGSLLQLLKLTGHLRRAGWAAIILLDGDRNRLLPRLERHERTQLAVLDLAYTAISLMTLEPYFTIWSI